MRIRTYLLSGLACCGMSLWAQNVGIGTATPTERLHVAGNLRLDGAFMPGNLPGANGNILLSAGPGVPPVWLPNGALGNILIIGPGGTPIWAPNPICASPTQDRHLRVAATAPTLSVCNSTLAENAAGNIWNADGSAPPIAGTDKFEIIATAAFPYAVNGYATGGFGVYGQATGTNGVGVVGTTNQASGIGVGGLNTNANGTAGYFENTAAAGAGTGGALFAVTRQSGGFAVWGAHLNTTAGTAVVGFSSAGGAIYPANARAGGAFTGDGVGVAGYAATATATAGQFVFAPAVAAGTAQGFAVWAQSAQQGGATVAAQMGTGLLNFFANAVVSAYHTGGNGPTGETPLGVIGSVPANSNGQGVFGQNTGTAGTDYAVYANGRFAATGTKLFLIDHPLDPENKYLSHFCTEGPEPYNLYRGVVTTDAQGRAVVELPAYFEAANRDYTYHLTPIGTFAQAVVVEEIRNNRFVIQTDKPNVKVSWMVLAVRDDIYARYFASPAEFEKLPHQKGKYLIPELYGKGPEYAIFKTVKAEAPAAQVRTASEEGKRLRLPEEKLRRLESQP